MKFNFPRTKFVDKNTFQEQLEHLASEIEEVKKAENWDELAEELLDTIHSAETALRILLRMGPSYFDQVIERAEERIIKKNRERGYYEFD